MSERDPEMLERAQSWLAEHEPDPPVLRGTLDREKMLAAFARAEIVREMAARVAELEKERDEGHSARFRRLEDLAHIDDDAIARSISVCRLNGSSAKNGHVAMTQFRIGGMLRKMQAERDELRARVAKLEKASVEDRAAIFRSCEMSAEYGIRAENAEARVAELEGLIRSRGEQNTGR